MGLLIALRALDVGPGDEVITTPMTFAATANAILHLGATPRFVDVEPATGLIDPAAVRAAVGPKTVGILPVHLYGQLADMKALRAIADAHGLFIVEDSAHGVEMERDGVRPGDLSEAAVFSFYATKNLTCGDGGAVATRDARVAERLRRLRNHGVSKAATERHGSLYQHWDLAELGYKANLTDLDAALLRPQIAHLDEKRALRERVALRYESHLRERIADLRSPPADGQRVPWLVERRGRELAPPVHDPRPPGRARRAPLEARRGRHRHGGQLPGHPSAHVPGRAPGLPRGALPVAEEMGDRTISLPMYPTLGVGGAGPGRRGRRQRRGRAAWPGGPGDRGRRGRQGRHVSAQPGMQVFPRRIDDSGVARPLRDAGEPTMRTAPTISRLSSVRAPRSRRMRRRRRGIRADRGRRADPGDASPGDDRAETTSSRTTVRPRATAAPHRPQVRIGVPIGTGFACGSAGLMCPLGTITDCNGNMRTLECLCNGNEWTCDPVTTGACAAAPRVSRPLDAPPAEPLLLPRRYAVRVDGHPGPLLPERASSRHEGHLPVRRRRVVVSQVHGAVVPPAPAPASSARLVPRSVHPLRRPAMRHAGDLLRQPFGLRWGDLLRRARVRVRNVGYDRSHRLRHRCPSTLARSTAKPWTWASPSAIERTGSPSGAGAEAAPLVPLLVVVPDHRRVVTGPGAASRFSGHRVARVTGPE